MERVMVADQEPEVVTLSSTLDEIRFSCLEDRTAEDALDRLACQVLRLTLEQVRAQ